ncbi:hypothetical protein F4V57_14655 [Acinetobacter qingfengensis]|uniref:Zona occludens toxin N-terminal domain-containing protein n=1 Tax=Acinetobacter qingfengensis TaxID=1262585 RepID=A0A1E7QZS5_9GAMM|nr:zonular occludens toxin domain-containing protein [Acinetobacter qingfengensis]KAA8730789.1 hypothetical protein F4V57_14655 [Acinetobacter qingfengensis]OEY92541.1 hypothetical protein BJI46_14555 [Acinetobacter qingfengensis]
MAQVAGGIIRLTCGGIGTGKSYKNVKDAEEIKSKNIYKKIYSNIRSHAKLSNGTIEEMPEDWRKCDDYSLIIFDEVQFHEKFSKHYSNRRDGEIVDLSMIRHRHIDIWLISPSPALVNADVKKLVNQYYWLEAQSKDVTKWWLFSKEYATVTKTIKNQALDESTYKIEEKYYNLYESTEDGTASGRSVIRNMRFVGFVVGMIFVLLIIVGLGTYLAKSSQKGTQALSEKEQASANTSQKKPEQAYSKITVENQDFECRKAENVDNEICKKWFDELSKNGKSLNSMNPDGSSYQTVDYNPADPFAVNKIEYQYQVKQVPVFSGCVKFDGRYYGYTQQATRLEISQEDCKRVMSGDRPFNPFSERSPVSNIAQNSVSTDQQLTREQFAKYHQAKEEGLI